MHNLSGGLKSKFIACLCTIVIVIHSLSVYAQVYGQELFQQQPFGEQPFGEQPFGEQPFGEQPFGDQEQVVQQGIVTSALDPLPGHEAHQNAIILSLREDNVVYSGILTFTATKPVDVQILHRNMTSGTEGPRIAEEFGELGILQLAGGNDLITVSNIVPDYANEDGTSFSASVPFSGNALTLHNIDGEPFAAAYTVHAEVVGPATRADNIAPAPISPVQQEDDLEEENNDN